MFSKPWSRNGLPALRAPQNRWRAEHFGVGFTKSFVMRTHVRPPPSYRGLPSGVANQAQYKRWIKAPQLRLFFGARETDARFQAAIGIRARSYPTWAHRPRGSCPKQGCSDLPFVTCVSKRAQLFGGISSTDLGITSNTCLGRLA